MSGAERFERPYNSRELANLCDKNIAMKWNKSLPDVSKWQPRSGKQETLRNALMITCRVAQRRIVARVEAETKFNIQNFDSGAGVEDVVREELASLLPLRYSVDAGIANDCHGNTAGDFDLVVRDHTWSPIIKPGATTRSRRFHFPVEGIYAALEIKQTLGFGQLDEAMEKLVTLSRLDRPANPYGHITENQHLPFFDKSGFMLNPLHTTVFATRLEDSVTFEEISNRFGAINASLDRNHVVTMLCVLNHGTAWYSVASGKPYDADFMRDRNQTLILQINGEEPDNAFYRLYGLLMGHLTRSVLGLAGVFESYGKPPPARTLKSYKDAAFNKNLREKR